MTESRRSLLVELPIRIKTYDIDFVGHVNNIVYVRWLEDLRLHLLDTYFPLEPMRQAGTVPIIVNTNLHYKQGISLSDHEVLARMWVREFGRATFFLEAEFTVDGEARCIASQRGAFVNSATMRPVRVPKELAEQFSGA